MGFNGEDSQIHIQGITIVKLSTECKFYCVNTSYPMDNLLNRLAQTGPPNVSKRRPLVPPAGRSVVPCTPQMVPRTAFLSRQPDVIATFSFGVCTVQTCFQQSPDILRKVWIMTDFQPYFQIFYFRSVIYMSSTDIHYKICWKRSLVDSI